MQNFLHHVFPRRIQLFAAVKEIMTPMESKGGVLCPCSLHLYIREQEDFGGSSPSLKAEVCLAGHFWRAVRSSLSAEVTKNLPH